jgi:hypothetical protein
LKNWSKKFARACAAISLLAGPSFAQPPASNRPAIALLDSADLAQWQTWTKDLGWPVIAPTVDAGAPIDTRIQALEKSLLAATQAGSADPSRIYLIGRGEAAAAVFYTVSRLPDLWAAAAALGGSPQPAIDSDRFYLANFTNVPLLWAGADPKDPLLAESLQAAGLMLDFRTGAGLTAAAVLEWLGRHTRPAYPSDIDCETNSPSFARCYWIQMTKFDPAERNDVLSSSRIQPSLLAALDLGGFGFKKDDPGPGVLVSYLPEKYSGPLKMGDRITALDGREIPDARHYVEMMAQITEERPAAATVQRGKERLRFETRIVIPKRAAAATARVQAKYLADDHQVQIISRTVTGMRVDVPAQWLPAVLNWNGVPLENMENAGCRLLTIEKAIEKSGPCP